MNIWPRRLELKIEGVSATFFVLLVRCLIVSFFANFPASIDQTRNLHRVFTVDIVHNEGKNFARLLWKWRILVSLDCRQNKLVYHALLTRIGLQILSLYLPKHNNKRIENIEKKNEEGNPCNWDLNFLIEIYLENRTHISFSKFGFQKLNPNFPIEHTKAFHTKCIMFISSGTSSSYSLL